MKQTDGYVLRYALLVVPEKKDIKNNNLTQAPAQHTTDAY